MRKGLFNQAMVKVVFGMMGSSVANTNILSNSSKSAELLSLLDAHGVREVDTARVYGSGASEARLGELMAPNQFRISTKAPAFSPGSLSARNIRKNCKASLNALNQHKVDIYYLHGPDAATPFEEQCAAINELYCEGKFDRFGISNLSSAQIQEVHDICRRQKFVLPTVYQGGYNPLLRTSEKHRLPLCRKLGLAFYAFSPLAGGFLAKPLDQVLEPKHGSRFAAMPVFGQIYCNASFIDAVRTLGDTLKRHNISTRAATLRWLMHHSALREEDAIILGASDLEQAQMNLEDCNGGPLPNDLILAFETLWETARDVKSPFEPEPW